MYINLKSKADKVAKNSAQKNFQHNGAPSMLAVRNCIDALHRLQYVRGTVDRISN